MNDRIPFNGENIEGLALMVNDPEQEILIDEIEVDVLTEKKVCVFWSNKGAERASIAASTENRFNTTSKNYDSCACPSMEADAALPACTYSIVEQSDEEIYCPFYKAEDNHLLFETSKGKVCTTRILDFEQMNMDRKFIVTLSDGSTYELDDPAEAYSKIKE